MHHLTRNVHMFKQDSRTSQDICQDDLLVSQIKGSKTIPTKGMINIQQDQLRISLPRSAGYVMS